MAYAVCISAVSTDPTFIGGGTFSGAATLSPAIGLTPIQSARLLTSEGGSTNQRSGALGSGTAIEHIFGAPLTSVNASGSGTLSCSVSDSTNGSASLHASGIGTIGISSSARIKFNLSIAGAGLQATVAAAGAAGTGTGGVVTGHAFVVTDTRATAIRKPFRRSVRRALGASTAARRIPRWCASPQCVSRRKVFGLHTGLDALLNPHLGELGCIGPVVVIVPTPFGPFPVTVCGNTCPVPVLPEASIDGSVCVTAGSTTVSRAVPVHLP